MPCCTWSSAASSGGCCRKNTQPGRVCMATSATGGMITDGSGFMTRYVPYCAGGMVATNTRQRAVWTAKASRPPRSQACAATMRANTSKAGNAMCWWTRSACSLLSWSRPRRSKIAMAHALCYGICPALARNCAVSGSMAAIAANCWTGWLNTVAAVYRWSCAPMPSRASLSCRDAGSLK